MKLKFKRIISRKTGVRIASVLLAVVLMCDLFTIVANAISYYTVRINYCYADGTPAHDPYIATYEASADPLNLEIKNPKITGYDPMTATDQTGVLAETSTIDLEHVDHNVELTIYYLAGLSTYRVMYYKQNIYDDLYTRDNTISSEYTNRRGKTGTNPTILETEELPGYEGFTNLFHEPDAIAADGSTVFRVYYDRNYYHVLFDLGSGGYGVEPVYAKYQSVYHISEPKRSGYTFVGWARTDKDSTQSDDWHYVNEDGDEITEEQALANPISLEGDQTVPAEDSYYKALWTSGNSRYSIVYWFQNPDGEDLTAEQLNNAGSIAAARTLISSNYSVVVAKDIENVPSGTGINLDTQVTNAAGQNISIKNFFGYDLSENGDFPVMSSAKRDELLGKSKYYEYNEALSSLQFGGAYEDDPEKDYIEVSGDGTTRINVYFNRKDFTLKFYYARQKLNNGVANGRIDLTNSTKGFSKDSNPADNPMHAIAMDDKYVNGTVSDGAWQSDIADSLPQIKSELLVENGGPLTPGYTDYSGFRYYYYQVSAKYNAPLANKWLVDAITPVHKKGNAAEQICYPGSWAVENGTNYYYSHTSVNNFTIKGFYEKLGDELMFKYRNSNYLELHYLVSWTNTASSGWNAGINRVLHFRYENFIEFLPKEVEKAENSERGVMALVDDGTYIDAVERTFTDLSGQTVTKMYGLLAANRIETIDSGDQYDRNKSLSTRNSNIRSNQTAAEMAGFTIENYRLNNKNQIILDENNTDIDWSEDTDNDRHATIKFFYHRNTYTLKYRNGNRLDRNHSVMYGAPLNSVYTTTEDGHEAGEYRYWYEDPQYFNEDLKDYYNFIGWYYTPYYYRQVDKDTATMPADDITLYAKWEPKTIKVSFYPTYNDYYEDVNRIGDEITVDYGEYVPHELIPANVEGEERPHLTPPATGAMFAGWYYLRDNIPVRFEPENLPVTALNQESSGEHATFHLYAEWVTKEVGKYEVKYVEKEHPENEVATPTTGRAFVWKTRTFNAKGGSELNAEHAWQDGGINWWPVANSHSIVIKANDHTTSEYSPNEYTFEYIQKSGVWYRVQYLDEVTHAPLADPVEYYTTDASVKADSLFIPGYVAEEMSKTLVLSASEKTGDAAKAEELENNVINFYYSQNDTEYLYEVEYYGQNVNDDNYELIQSENIEVAIADNPDTPAVEPTTVALSDIYTRQYAMLFEVNGFARVPGATQQVVANPDGTTTTTALADDSSFTVTSDRKTTIRVYFNRKLYPYTYRYVDYHAERRYLDTPEGERDGMWNGVMETHNSTQNERVEKEVTIPAPINLTYTDELTQNEIPYIRVSENEIVLTIAPNEINTDVNIINVYYRKFDERELQYKLVCKDSPYNELDYDNTKNPPQALFGGLSMTGQTVDAYNEIQSVNFYDFNEAYDPSVPDTMPDADRHLHNHRYTFLGWFDNPEGTGTPLSTDATLTPAEMVGNTGELPARNTTYYAVVEQDMVRANFEFRTVDVELPIGGDSSETAEDRQAADIVRAAPTDSDGSKTGSVFNFSSPNNYTSGSSIPWHRSQGYSLTVDPIDNRVYKYEFAEWWEEDLTPGENYHKLIRKKNWNSDGEWSPTVLERVLDRQNDKHVIAVFKRRVVTELPYTINYKYIDRQGVERTYVVNGTLTGDELIEGKAACKITNDGDYRLTDEFIVANSPFESNYGETLRWSDKNIVKTSEKGDGTTTQDHLTTTVTAVQTTKTVYAHYRLTPNATYDTDANPMIRTFYGANRETDENMQVLLAPDSFNGMEFSYWAVRKSNSDSAPIVAKSYDRHFDLCMMDSYFITPVYEGAAEDPPAETPQESDPTITLTHLDYTRNRWTDDEGEVAASGETDLLYTDFEIAFEDNKNQIYNTDGIYQAGVVFERIGKMGANTEFDPDLDYGYLSDAEPLKAAILNGGSSYTTTNKVGSSATKNRKIQLSPINTQNMTNRNRIEFAQYYKNAYTLAADGETKNYSNSQYLLKATAYLIKDGQVYLSNSVYVCLKGIAAKDNATGINNIWDTTPAPTTPAGD